MQWRLGAEVVVATCPQLSSGKVAETACGKSPHCVTVLRLYAQDCFVDNVPWSLGSWLVMRWLNLAYLKYL